MDHNSITIFTITLSLTKFAPIFVLSMLLLPLGQSANADDTKQQNLLSSAEVVDGWQLLFNGRDLDGWRNYAAAKDLEVENWQAVNGELVLQGSGGSKWQLIWNWLLQWFFNKPNGDLIYASRAFKNFELSIDWNISSAGNSGVFYLVADEEHGFAWQTGLEMQVLDNEGHWDGKIEKHRAGDLYDIKAATLDAANEPGHWNIAKVVVRENEIQHWLNNKLIVETTRDSEEWKRLVSGSKFDSMPDFGRSDTGYVVLQDHGDTVRYRNIKLRELQ